MAGIAAGAGGGAAGGSSGGSGGTSSSGGSGGSSGSSSGTNTEITAEQSVRNYGKEWSGGLSAEDKRSLHEYTGMAYGNINRVLRGIEDSFDPGNLENARNIHRILSQAEIPADCVVYRGASEAALGAARILPDSLLVGRTISDDGFMSTSLDRGSAFADKVLFEIDVPKGAAGAYVGDISSAGHYEREVLFDKDQVLIITSVTRDEYGRRIIKAKMRGRR